MTITVTDHPNGLFNRHRVTERSFTDEGGSFDAAMEHMALLVACERDFAVQVHTPTRALVDATLEHVASLPLPIRP